VGSKISKLTQAIVDANREVIRAAMEAFVAQEALARFGYAPKDVVRTPQVEPPATVGAPTVAPEPEAEGFSPSEAEMNTFTCAKYRLFFLVRNDVLFQEAQKLTFRKTKTSFRVYYGRPNNGSLFDYREQKDGKILLQFPALNGKEVVNAPSPELDDCLLKSFTQRLAEAGISTDSPPVLRAIKGGQPSGDL
jgi:predicted type IV restriction endonuclease